MNAAARRGGISAYQDGVEMHLEELGRKNMSAYDENNDSENAVVGTMRKHNWKVRWNGYRYLPVLSGTSEK